MNKIVSTLNRFQNLLEMNLEIIRGMNERIKLLEDKVKKLEAKKK